MVEQDLSCSGDFKLLLQTAEGKLQLGVVPVEGNAAETSRQAQPPLQEMVYFPLKALYGENWNLIDEQGPEESGQSTAESHEVRSLLVAWRATVSFRSLVKSLAKLLTGISATDGILASSREKRKFSASLPFRSTRDLDLAGLKLILAQVMSRLIVAHAVTISGTDEVVNFFLQAREVATAPLSLPV